MHFQVPQFIEIEDKLFGPLTFKQFIYLLGGGAIAFVAFKLLPQIIAILVAAPFVGFALALAFYKINDRPFINIVESWVAYKLGTKLYTWKRREYVEEKKKNDLNKEIEEEYNYVPKVSQSRLKEMSWSLDVLDASKKN
jgi:hypothetical protein